MPRNVVRIAATPEDVFAVLDDACAYPRWVVGARRIRWVDAAWPAEGARFHHALGVPGGELQDSSKVVLRDPPRRMELEVRFRPPGVALVQLDISRDGARSVVTMEETAVSGPVAHVPRVIIEPLIKIRNAISLERLRHEVERRVARSDGRR